MLVSTSSNNTKTTSSSRGTAWLLAAWVALGLTGAGCFGSAETGPVGPEVSSETHLLKLCDGECEDGLTCICGVCTASCEATSECSGLSEEASCSVTSAISFFDECPDSGPTLSLCSIECAADEDCSGLEGERECQDGLCVNVEGTQPAADTDEPDVETQPDVVDANDGDVSEPDIPEADVPEPIESYVPPGDSACVEALAKVDRELPAIGNPVRFVCACDDGASAGCVAGDDANSGETPDEPWRSIEKVVDAYPDLQPGESIALCRGGSFEVAGSDAIKLGAPNCTAEQPCGIVTYLPEAVADDVPAPLLYRLDGWEGLWLEDLEVFSAGMVLVDLRLNGFNAEGLHQGTGIRVGVRLSDVTLCGVEVTGFDTGIDLAVGLNEDGFVEVGEGVSILGASLVDLGGPAVRGAVSSLELLGSTINNNVHPDTLDPRVALDFLNRRDVPVTDMVVAQNDIFNTGFKVGESGVCDTVGVRFLGRIDAISVQSNRVAWGADSAAEDCMAVALGPAVFEQPNIFNNATIDKNEFWGFGGIGLAVNNCEDCLIDNNVLVGSVGSPAIQYGIKLGSRIPEAGEPENSGCQVRNNTINLPGGGAKEGAQHIAVGSADPAGSNHVVVSNAIYLAEFGLDTLACFEVAEDAIDVMDNNLCYSPNTDEALWNASGGLKLPGWQGLGHGLASTGADPAFVQLDSSLETANFQPIDGSPLVGAGHPTLSTEWDITGSPRDSEPDIGAHEFGVR